MDEIEREGHLLHARTSGYQIKLARAWEIIERAMETRAAFYLAFSGGADSTVLLDLLYAGNNRIDVLWGDEAWDYPESLQFIADCEQRYDFQVQRVRDLNAWRACCVALDRPDLRNEPDSAWHNPYRTWRYAWDTQHPEQMPTMTYSGVFLGLLASESRARRITLRGGARTRYQVKTAEGKSIHAVDGRDYEWHCCPMASWTKRDVWAYLISQNVPYNPVYDILAALGVPLEVRRVAALSYIGVAQYGSHAILKSGWPALYNQLAATFPKVREYV